MPIRLSGMASGMDTDAMIKELMSAQSMKKVKIEQKKTKLEWKQEKWSELNAKIYKLYTDQLSKLRLEGSYATKKVTSSNGDFVAATASPGAGSGSHTIEVNKLASAQYVTGQKMEGLKNSTKLTDDTVGMEEGQTIKITSGKTEKSLEITKDTTIADLVKTMRDAGLNASFDENQGRFFISSTNSGKENVFSIQTYGADSGAADSDKPVTGMLAGLGLTDIDENGAVVGTKPDDFSIVEAEDAEIILDGAKLTGSSNSFEVAGVTYELKNKTTEPVTLTVTNDAQAAFDMVKDFVKGYNELLKEMNKLYGADSARGYEPLTDDEKEAMSDKQVELWENKIKDSLLRRDGTLDGIMTTLRTSLHNSVTVNGKNYSLSSFGIETGDYTEKGLLHIGGDSEDQDFADKENKLMKMLNENPDDVAAALSQIGKNLYAAMQDKMKSTSMSSALTFYNDKEMKKQIGDYNKDISKWESRLQDMENRYYKQFTAMETAMSKLQSQSNYFASMLGG